MAILFLSGLTRGFLKIAAGLGTAFIIGATPLISKTLGVWERSVNGELLNIERYHLTFDEPFNRIAFDGPRLFAPVHPPYGAGLFDPPDTNAYHVKSGILSISAYRRSDKWHSGSVQTADADQAAGQAPFYNKRGFACRGCYFETRMRLPSKEPGFWGAFWLLSPETALGHVEIDVLEWYGGDPKGHHQAVHIWPKDRRTKEGLSNYISTKALLDGDWHSYGAQVIGDIVHIYMDRHEISRIKVPGLFDTLLYPVATLAVFPKEQDIAREGMYLDVDYIRAYQPRD